MGLAQGVERRPHPGLAVGGAVVVGRLTPLGQASSLHPADGLAASGAPLENLAKEGAKADPRSEEPAPLAEGRRRAKAART